MDIETRIEDLKRKKAEFEELIESSGNELEKWGYELVKDQVQEYLTYWEGRL